MRLEKGVPGYIYNYVNLCGNSETEDEWTRQVESALVSPLAAIFAPLPRNIIAALASPQFTIK